VPGFPLRVEVTRDEAVTLATWRTSPIDELIGAGALSLFVAVLAFALVRQVRRLRQINRRLQSSQQQYPRADPQVAPDRVVPPDTLRGQCGAY
jgi:flagellar biosynthesis/type III secretory pathway M-ring protein FliF/YscJ